VPFSMSGQGQQSAIKISLAMSRHAGRAKFVMVEEPENHLTCWRRPRTEPGIAVCRF